MPSTRNTLLRFHGSHFPAQQLPSLSHATLGFPSRDAVHELVNTLQGNDRIGYYEDGVKRTLSDEQVAIFRHTEIQELLRERRGRVEPLAESAAGSGPLGESSRAKAPLVETEEQSSTPLNIQKRENYVVNDDKRPGGNTMRYLDCLKPLSEQDNADFNHTEQD